MPTPPVPNDDDTDDDPDSISKHFGIHLWIYKTYVKMCAEGRPLCLFSCYIMSYTYEVHKFTAKEFLFGCMVYTFG